MAAKRLPLAVSRVIVGTLHLDGGGTRRKREEVVLREVAIANNLCSLRAKVLPLLLLLLLQLRCDSRLAKIILQGASLINHVHA